MSTDIGIAYPYPRRPRGGVVPEPNANPNEFKPEIDRLMTVKECAEFCNVYQGRIHAAIQMMQLRYVDLGLRTRGSGSQICENG
ncbi:MAG TPA: hypothetical protein VN939_18230 [Chthoniobacterales bacterium]|jgi:hypothetical protein|nr:hypothetical protein [Chthoniobacterales bacterium]